MRLDENSPEFNRGRLYQFLRMRKERPIDPIYWDMHEEKDLRELINNTLEEFERKILHLSQDEVITTTLSAITKILIEKGICTEEELQNKFLVTMRPEEEKK
jgi:hypothetical protein